LKPVFGVFKTRLKFIKFGHWMSMYFYTFSLKHFIFWIYALLCIIIYKCKVVISVCLFIYPIITHKHLHRFASNFNGELIRTTVMFLAWFWDSKLSGSTFKGKIAKIVIYDKVRVNGGTNWLPWAALGSQASFE